MSILLSENAELYIFLGLFCQKTPKVHSSLYHKYLLDQITSGT